jgi:hypothetical protein
MMFRNQTIHGRRAPRVLALVATTLAALALVVTLAPLAGAQTPDPGSPGGHPQLTDAQKACLTQHGVQVPAKPAAGQQPTRPTDAQRQAFEAAAKACGLPARRVQLQLTAAQRTCLTQHGVTLPAKGSAKPAPPTDAQRQAFEAAAKACGLPAPPNKAPSSNS